MSTSTRNWSLLPKNDYRDIEKYISLVFIAGDVVR